MLSVPTCDATQQTAHLCPSLSRHRSRRPRPWRATIGALALGAAFSLATLALAQDAAPPAPVANDLPLSIRLYEQVKHRLPVHTVDGVPLQGLNLCRVVQRCATAPVFFLLPGDFEPSAPCDLSQVLLAYGGWCAVGIVNQQPHLAPSMFPFAHCMVYGETTVITLNNGLKAFTVTTEADEAAAVAWLSHLPDHVEPWSPGVPLIPAVWRHDLPPHPVSQ